VDISQPNFLVFVVLIEGWENAVAGRVYISRNKIEHSSVKQDQLYNFSVVSLPSLII
jgi:hypothetical protein